MNFTRHHAIVTLAIGLFCLASCGDNSSSEGPVASAEDTGTHSSSEEFLLSSSNDSNWGSSSSVEESSSSIEPNSSSELVESVESSSSSALVESSSSAESSSSESPVVSSSSKSLEGVVWYVVGDSFSAGDFEGLDPKPTIKEGKYAGKPPVVNNFRR